MSRPAWNIVHDTRATYIVDYVHVCLLPSCELVESPLGWVTPASNLTGEALITIEWQHQNPEYIITQSHTRTNICMGSII